MDNSMQSEKYIFHFYSLMNRYYLILWYTGLATHIFKDGYAVHCHLDRTEIIYNKPRFQRILLESRPPSTGKVRTIQN